MDLDLSEPESPILDYARTHGLSRDYALESPFYGVIPTPADDAYDEALRLPIEATYQPSVHILLRERLAVNKDTAILLKEVLSGKQALVNDEDQQYRAWKEVSGLKLERPLLSTDSELDLLEFGSTKEPDLNDLRVPLDSVDEENDEGLCWPSSYLRCPEKCFDQINSDKIRVSKEVLVLLQDTVTDPWTTADDERVQNEIYGYKRNMVTVPITPPILPLSPPIAPYIPSSPANRLELLSENSNSPAKELKEIEARIMRDDAPTPELLTQGSDEMLLDDFDPRQDSLYNLSPGPVKRKAQDLKVEGPLTPDLFSDSPMKRIKSVSFKDMVDEFILELPSTFESGSDILNDGDSFAGFFKDIGPIADHVNRRVENEKLSEVDTTRRLDVPQVDFTLPVAPWDLYARPGSGKVSSEETELDAQRKFLVDVKRNDLKTWTSWHGVSKLERELNWAVFPIEWGNIQLEENLHGEEPLSKIFSKMAVGDIATSSTDIWKRDGLRILENDDDSEDELEVADFEEQSTLNSALMKRKREIQDDEENKNVSNSAFRDEEMIALERHQQHRHQREREHQSSVRIPENRTTPVPRNKVHQGTVAARQKREDSSLMFGGKFSASAALQNFMGMQGKESKSEPRAKKGNTRPSGSTSNLHTPLHAHQTNSEFRDMTPAVARMVPEKFVPLVLPAVPEHLLSCCFILSSTILKQRRLLQEVQKTYTAAVFIERDFSLPHSPSDEADVILSPSTGLICTTMLQIKQRALPGQPDRSPIKERIIAMQARYERLVVLVSEGLSRDAEQQGTRRPVDSRDQEALSEFQKLVSVMEAEVLHSFVQGGEMALARAIVIEMEKWGLPDGSRDIGELKLLQEETTWEVFLRRAGLNPFAAQIILATLKDPYDLALTSSSPGASEASEFTITVAALPAFILLSAEERIARFQVLLGGNRILGRVNALIDRTWMSAANGFAL